MKRFLITLLFVILMIVPFSTVSAINLDEAGPHVMAEFMPDTTAIFGTSRIGTDFIEELDGIILGIYDKLPDDLEINQPLTLSEALRQAFAEEGIDWGEFSSLLGNYVAFGMEPVGGFDSNEDPLITAVVEITDQAGAEELLLEIAADAPNMPERQMDGDTILYRDDENNIKLMLTPTHLIFSSDLNYQPDAVESPLSENANYLDTINLLNADSYNMLMYVSEPTMESLLRQGNMNDLQQMGVQPGDAGAVAIGLTILTGDTFTVDIAVQTRAPAPTSTVNLDFLNAMPGSTDAFIVATDLTNVYNSLVATIRAAAEENGEDDPTAQIPLVFNFTGLDLEEDVLSWTTGGYGIFLGADFMSIIEEAYQTGTVSELSFDAGIVIEATDVALARNAATELGEFLGNALATEDGVTITQETINDFPVTSILVETPLDPSAPPIVLEFVLTATNDFFFLGTRSAFDAILEGNTLASNSDFNESTQYFLDDTTSVWYTNSDGVVVSTLFPVAFFGVSTTSAIENIIMDFDADSSSDDDDTPVEDPFALFIDVLNAYDDILRSMTITTAVDDGGVVRIRATMSVNP